MFKFQQVEGIIGKLVVQDCETFDELDAAARRASNSLIEMEASTNCYYKCDILRDGKVIDRFDLKPINGRGVDDLGRTPSQMLKRYGITE